MNKPLSPEEITVARADLPGWNHDRDALAKTFKFQTFREAFSFMTHVAFLAEAMDHHPEWLNVYNRVEVILATHTVDGVSDLDIKLARAMDQLAPARDRG